MSYGIHSAWEIVPWLVVFIQDLELELGVGEQDGSRMIVACKSTLMHM